MKRRGSERKAARSTFNNPTRHRLLHQGIASHQERVSGRQRSRGCPRSGTASCHRRCRCEQCSSQNDEVQARPRTMTEQTQHQGMGLRREGSRNERIQAQHRTKRTRSERNGPFVGDSAASADGNAQRVRRVRVPGQTQIMTADHRVNTRKQRREQMKTAVDRSQLLARGSRPNNTIRRRRTQRSKD